MSERVKTVSGARRMKKKKKKKEEGGGGAHHCQASRIQGIYRLP